MLKDLRALRDIRAPKGFTERVLAAVFGAERFAPLPSTVGTVYVAWNARGISAVMFADSDADFRSRFERRFGRRLERAAGVPPTLKHAVLEGDAASKRRLTYDLSSCSEFEAAVLRKTLEIPRGQVRPYNWIAREIGRPKAVRAVGTALKKNPVPLLVPCHRVVRGDGTFGEYALGGPSNKIRLLKAEGVKVDCLQASARAGIRFTGSATTKIFCLPTCADVQGVSEKHLRSFHSEREALDAGFRPCKHCRPAAA